MPLQIIKAMQEKIKTIKVNDMDFEFFISEQEIENNIKRMANEIRSDLTEESNPLFVCMLNGAFMFASELIKCLDMPWEISFTSYSSYKGTSSTGVLTEKIPITEDIKGRTIILLEDIVETGLTIYQVINKLKDAGAKDVKLATMLFKPAALQHDLKPDYVGLEIENDFIVGHGLDYDQKGRGLKDIYKIVQTTEC